MDSQELQLLKNRYDIVGNDAALNHALETAVKVAPTDMTVLITGESGVGKEVIPQIIHQNSRRRSGKYFAVNCGGLPSGTINAELFGHEKGAFTGAIGERKGYFEEANGGTLVLDEIGELPLETQAMLLRVLQNGEYMRVGSSKVEKTDVRIIAATNVNLAYAVATGKFRADLYYRIFGIQIVMPPLRERKDDIYLLFRKFSSDFASKNGLCKISLSHEAITMLSSYRWPGNIRQLRSVSEAVTGICSRPVTNGADRLEIDAATLSTFLPDEKDSLLPAAPGAAQSSTMSDSDKQMIVKAIMDLKSEIDDLQHQVDTLRGGHILSSAPAIAAPSSAAVQQPAAHVSMADEPEEQSFASAETVPQPEAPRSIKQTQEELIDRTLAKYSGKVKPTAAELGISERTIYRYLAQKKKA